MVIGQKRKRRWGSKSLFKFRHAKFQVLGDFPDAAAGSGAARRSGLFDGFIEESNSEDNNVAAGTAAKIRRTRSRLISIVRFAVVNGMCNTMNCRVVC